MGSQVPRRAATHSWLGLGYNAPLVYGLGQRGTQSTLESGPVNVLEILCKPQFIVMILG